MASATSLGERCSRLAETLLVTSQASAVGLMAVSPEDGTHRPMLNVEYPPETEAHHTTTRFRQCRGLQQILLKPDQIQCWDDVPNFRDSFEAQAVYRPAGYHNGISVVLKDGIRSTVALLHVSTKAEKLDPEIKHLLVEIRPLVAEWAAVLARFEMARLSSREGEVLALMRDGLTNSQIASELVVAPRTVTTHVESILRKLRTGNRTEAAVMAEKYGLARPERRPAVA